ncbi:MAG: hypothetical protein FWE63_05905 [Bacteroidales bacterium]|nr:hypothetical protein [Bacteroidales bacterium]
MKQHKIHLKFVVAVILSFFGMFAVTHAQSPGGINMVAGGYRLDLWIDGNSANGAITTWANLAPATHTFQGTSGTGGNPTVQNSRFNFHRELNFAPSNQLRANGVIDVVQETGYYVFAVSENRGGSGILVTYNCRSCTDANQLQARNASLRWENSNTLGVRWNSGNTNIAPHSSLSTANDANYAIASLNVWNAPSGGIAQVAVNGQISGGTTIPGITIVDGRTFTIGQGNSAGANCVNQGNQFDGNMQELIVMRGPALMSDADVRKIHSYLAIKYGITLESDYSNSDETTVWNRTTNENYNNHIFGIARDDASGLYQVQSQSVESDLITLYKGTLATLNSNNPTFRNGFNNDKTFVMLGSNGLSGYQSITEVPAGTGSFLNGSIGRGFDVQSNIVYKAQVVGGGQTVNMDVNDPLALYVLVSSRSDFEPNVTRAYAINSGTASNVVINDGEYITLVFNLQDFSFGAINASVVAWLTPDSYNASGTWTNHITSGGIGNFISQQTAPVRGTTGGYNFHPVVTFSKTATANSNTRLFSQLPIGITANDNVTTIFVFQRRNTQTNNSLIGFGNTAVGATGRGLWFATANSNTLTSGWSGTQRTIGDIENGILIVDNPNAAGGINRLNIYNNGIRTDFASQQWNGTTNNTNGLVALGAIQNNATNTSGQGFQGDIQEVILIKNPGNGNLNPIDLQKIHSYLAIKYGISLNRNDDDGDNEDYISSTSETIWNRSINAGYNNHIFGIGRDDASRLNQVQSRNSESDFITLYKGTLNTLNNNAATLFANDKTFVIVGSNGASGYQNVTEQPAGTVFANGAIARGFDVQSNTIYRAQVTGGAQTVNIDVNDPLAMYVLVSSESDFRADITHVYEINGQTASNVVINNGQYITLGFNLHDFASSKACGAINTSFVAWLTPSNYTPGTWNNLITSGGIGNFTAAAPATPPTLGENGYNYHQAINFTRTGTAAPNRLFSQQSMGITANDNVTTIFVFQKDNTSLANNSLISFSNTAVGATARALYWATANSNTLTSAWGSTITIGDMGRGILTVDHPNIAGGYDEMNVYNNGAETSYTSRAWGTPTVGTGQVAIGAIRNDNTAVSNGFQGNIQEVILIKNPGNGNVDPIDLQKIHSYLSIKYAIPLDNNDDYINSSGETIWDRRVNTGYNTHIFGIGRDDMSRLYQVQSRSTESNLITLYKGTLNPSLNDNNPAFNNTSLGFANDKTFVILGSNGLSGYQNVAEHLTGSTEFVSGALTRGFNVQSNTIYKAQVTGGVQTVNIDVSDPLAIYVLVSSRSDFRPNTTRVYDINSSQTANNVAINNGEYITLVFNREDFLSSVSGALNTSFVAWLTPDSYNAGTWTNHITPGGIGNFSGASTAPIKGNTGGYNFHPVVTFNKASQAAAPNRIQSAQPLSITANDNVTTIFVFQRNSTSLWEFLIGFGPNGDNNAMSWRTANNDNLSLHWPGGTERILGAVRNGILAVSNSNTTATAAQEGTRVYRNGFRTAIATGPLTRNGQVSIGGRTNGDYGYIGNIQEVILVKQSGNGHIDPTDLQKIHSYLSIKYGIPLNNNDYYLNSIGEIIWDRSLNAGYNTNIFGIGRDDMSRLYQVQSRSTESNLITLHKGTLAGLNDENSAFGNGFADDKTFVILGADNTSVGYTQILEEYPADAFIGGVGSEIINVRTAISYKSQVSGGSRTQTVNISTNDPLVEYVLVSTVPHFAPSNTRIYPIVAQTANNVVINNGAYITFARSMNLDEVPFGAINTSSVVAWLTPDSYNGTGTWTNLITDGIGNFTHQQVAPVKSNFGGYNFHPIVRFSKTAAAAAPNRLFSEQPIGITANDNVTTIFVFQRANRLVPATLMGFSNVALGATARGLWFPTANSGALTSGWGGSTRTMGTVANGILTIDNPNAAGGANQVNLHNNGLIRSYASQQWNGTANAGTGRVALGALRNDATALNGFQGFMQEVILIKKPNNGNINSLDLQKIHSYLAIKYGMTLENNDNYVDSKGQTVWGRDPNYNRDIFGIGRDDITSLFQKQSRSINSNGLTAFVGNRLENLNSENTGTLGNMQYLMFGRHIYDQAASRLTEAEVINDESDFANGPADNDILFDAQSTRYKAQVTGASSITVNLMTQSSLFSHVLLSKTDAFNDKSIMKIYSLEDGVAKVDIDLEYRYIKFIGFEKGPGGVKENLFLWLKSDDINSLNIVHLGSDAGGLENVSNSFFDDPDAVPTVAAWSDLLRDQGGSHVWEYIRGSGGDNEQIRRPIYTESHRLMNYKPSIRFWGNGTYQAYLRNLNALAANSTTHTAFFLMNNNFSAASRIYQMGFRANTLVPSATSGYAAWGPTYGVERITNTTGAGRYRGQSGTPTGTQGIFTTGNTTITSYYVRNANPNAGVTFRFNGQQQFASGTSTTNFNTNSTLGAGIGRDRSIIGFISEVILYQGIITEGPDGAAKQNAIESYLALKYGITLRPTTNANRRFDYKFSNGEPIWLGETGAQHYGNYYNRVASVIRDDIADLDNRHSISTNVGSLLHLGVAGTFLDVDGRGDVGMLADFEAVTFGDNNATGFTPVQDDECGSINERFNRIWLIHKQTKDNRPITMLVGAQDNRGYNIGDEATVLERSYYARLTGSHKLYMLVANNEADIMNNTYKQVVPMTFRNGVWQCSYTFTEEDTYITFGTNTNTTGCMYSEGEVFEGSRKFSWSQWTRAFANQPATSAGRTYSITDLVDLDGDVVVTKTEVIYPQGVGTTRYNPIVTNAPEARSLHIRRNNAVNEACMSNVEIRITFDRPVIPEFTISGIDMVRSGSDNSTEIVEVVGYCDGNIFVPNITAADNTSRGRLTINGNTITSHVRASANARERRNMAYVAFEGGTREIVIRYRTSHNLPRAREIFISPITVRTVPPAPPINEDGMSFVKQANTREITTCESVEYSFFIENTNCDDKYVQFLDTLPEYMTWDAESLVLDTTNALHNKEIRINNYAENRLLKIDSLVIPAASRIRLRATAVFDTNAPSGMYNNRATIVYDAIENSVNIVRQLHSLDRETLELFPSIFSETQQRPQKVEVDVTAPKSYRQNDEITVTYKINNPNDPIPDMYLDIDYNEGFKYVNNSFRMTDAANQTISGVYRVTIDDVGSPMPLLNVALLSIAGHTNGESGFTLPSGISYMTFKLKAPELYNDLLDELDNNGEFVTKETLEILYSFSSEVEDPCVLESITTMRGETPIPYGNITHIKTNRNRTFRIFRRR